ncbi:MAG: DUF5053 domain-containing protein [Bacteroidales bacterium]|nr:DUF5053 domain-containing protein [Bacteroidales bacterium]
MESKDREQNEMMSSNSVLNQITELKESDLMNVLNGTYIAKRFFGRSRSWFSRKVNHCLSNGKPDGFTPDERKQLAKALRVLAFEIDELAESLE